jgi:hypothetical protein
MLAPNPDLAEPKALTEQEALQWLTANRGASSQDSELAELWGWNEAKVRRRRQAWEAQGLIDAAPKAQHQGAAAITETVSSGNQFRHPRGQGGGSQRLIAYLTAIALAMAAAYFSIGGLVELFPAQEIAVAVLGGILEVAKLVMVAWLTAHWRFAGWQLRLVMMLLVVGLVVVNAGGTFARLIESHFALNDAAATAVDERRGVLDAEIAEQARRVSDIERQDREIADVIATMTAKGQTKTALASIGAEQARRDVIGRARQDAADKLVQLKAQRSHLEADGKRVFAETGSARFLALQLGTDAETVIRWLVLCLVLLIDPSAIVLTIAATMRHEG